ncbi:acyl-CoA dehydrogenase family protein [Actinosynnema sp. NPDC020468]|uniref:acyl-CoA dehydrogenase family protein n=1 Tax=Actinosynnema sp. NPDC020468 TaxID=3154488 RepID=UPI0033CF7371
MNAVEEIVPASLVSALAKAAGPGEHPGWPSRATTDLVRESGLLGVMVPVAHGGAGGSPALGNAVLERVATADPSAAIMLFLHGCVVARLDAFATEEQKRRWLPGIATGALLAASAWSEPGSTADKRTLRTKAKRGEDGGWVLSGAKSFATGSVVADLFLVLTELDVPPATPAAEPAPKSYGGDGQALFVVERGAPGLQVPDETADLSGMRGSGTGFLTLRDCAVPGRNLLGTPEDTRRIIGRPHELGLTLGAVSTGIAQSAVDLVVAHLAAKGRASDPVAQHRVVEMGITVAAARAMTQTLPTTTTGVVAQAYATKVFASRASEAVCRDAAWLLGSAGFMESHEMNRIRRDAAAVNFMGPPNELCLELLRGSVDWEPRGDS